MKKEYEVLRPLKSDRLYAPGESVELDEEEAKALLDAGVIENKKSSSSRSKKQKEE